MGIKGLWSILDAFSERKPLYELFGKTVAIDLAGWICESLCVVDYQVQAKFYLRNLFFRTCYLLMSGVNPVFVLEGTAPTLKHDVISKRNEIQFRGAQPRKQKETADKSLQTQKKSSKGRSQFNYVLKQCEELIKSMGLHCVQAPGEAEAFCAQLNEAKLVDGIISQDSDCFAYGARRVYRNFTMSMQKTATAIGGAVDVYDLDVVRKSMDFGRNKIILMALICGCDYCPGVDGIGIDAIKKLFFLYSDDEIMERVKSWRSNDSKYTSLELKVDDKTICVSCGHYGKELKHAKTGCGQCKTSTGCDSSLWKQKRLGIKTELQIRKKTMAYENFPSQEIINEFMQQPIEMSSLELNWCQPNLIKFLRFMSSKLKWEEIYCFQKFLPLLTRWQLQYLCDDARKLSMVHGCVSPEFIKKKRTPKGIASFEIIWKDDGNNFTGIIPEKQLTDYISSNDLSQEEARQRLWTTIEPADLVEKAYPEIVEQFENTKTKPKSKKNTKETNNDGESSKIKKTRKKKADCSLNDMSALMKAVNELSDEKENKIIKNLKSTKLIPAKRNKKTEKCRTLEQFFKKNDNPSTCTISSPKIKTAMLNLSDFSFNIDLAEDENDLMEVIEDIVSKPPEMKEFEGRKLLYENFNVDMKKKMDICDESEEELDEFDLIVMKKKKKMLKSNVNSSTPILVEKFLSKHYNRTSSPYQNNKMIETSFFGGLNDEIDLFERSVDLKNIEEIKAENGGYISSDNDSSSSIEDNDKESICNETENYLNTNDTFDDFLGLGKSYIPITDQMKDKWNST